MLDLWQPAEAGQGHTVLVSGEPGVGKSHLIQGLRRALAEKASSLLVYECSPFYSNSAFQVLASQLARAAGLQRADTTNQKIEKLESLVAPGTQLWEAVPLIGFICGVPTDHHYPRLDLRPEDRKAAVLALATHQLKAICAAGSVLTIVEDAHWIDPSSEEMLREQIEQTPGLPHLLIVSHRQGLEPASLKDAPVTRLRLGRLNRANAESLMARVVGEPLPPALQTQIWEKSDGVPLFVEEITKSVLESGILDQLQQGESAASIPDLAVPETLQDSLMARLDRLGPVKETVQHAAVLGRSFAVDTLQAMMGMDARQMERSLAELINAELVNVCGQPPNETYIFRHTLLQETAYTSMLRGRRQMLHRLAAEAIERIRPDTVERTPEMLSHHWREAGEFAAAYPYAMQAGERALARYAHTEARVRFTEAADAAAELDYGLRMEAEALVRRAGVPGEKAAIHGDLGDFSAIREAVETLGDATLVAEVDFRTGWLHYGLGDFEAAILDATQSYEQAEIISVLAFSYGMSGEFGKASASANEAVRLAESIGNLPTKAACSFNRGVILGWWS